MRAGELPPITRRRLIERLEQGSVGLVEAGAGHGKSVLASQYRQRLGIATAYVALGPPDRNAAVLVGSMRRALTGARLSDLVAATEGQDADKWVESLLDALAGVREETLLILDDVHHLQSFESAALVLRLAGALPPQHRLLIAGRSFARHLEPLWGVANAARLSTTDLMFTEAETAELLRDRTRGDIGEQEIRVAFEETQGWATALVLAAALRAVDGDAGPPFTSAPNGPVVSPLRGILGAMAPADSEAINQLAHLPFVSPQLCDAVAGHQGAFEAIIASGVPLARTDTGWWELPGPVVAYLTELGPLRREAGLAAARIYESEGELVAAQRVLLAAGLNDEAAGRLAALGPERAELLGLGVVRDLVDSLPADVVEKHPRVLLHLARLAETAHQPELRARTLERAAVVVSDRSEPELSREVVAERARDLMWDERTRTEAADLASAVVRDAGLDELVARVRALDVLGRLASWFSSSGPQPQAEAMLLESARLARRLGQTTWAAQALTALGAGFYFALCRYEQALDVLDAALAELPSRNRYRATIHTFRVDALIELERWDGAEAALKEMREIGVAFREKWILAFAAWLEAALASYRGDAERTVRAYREIDRHIDAWFDQPAGGECLAQVADHLARVGRAELAFACLARAREKMAGNERIVRVHGAAVLARCGDPAQAQLAIEEALEGPAAEPHELWPLRLQRAYVAGRLGDPGAGQLAVEAFEFCDQLGLARGPLIREPVLGNELLPVAADAGSQAARELVSRGLGSWSLQLLGGFSLTRAGRSVGLPPGYPATAIRMIAVLGGSVHSETLIELLWPNAAPGLARNRLRNLLSRVRVAAGELVLRRGEMVELAPDCEVDVQRFSAMAEAALAAGSTSDPRRRVVLARAALELYQGELLPDDRFEEWAGGPREQLRHLQLELLDLLADVATDEGEFDESIRIVRRAIEVEPGDANRYMRLARLLELQGRSGSARAVLRQAQAAGLDIHESLD